MGICQRTAPCMDKTFEHLVSETSKERCLGVCEAGEENRCFLQMLLLNKRGLCEMSTSQWVSEEHLSLSAMVLLWSAVPACGVSEMRASAE